MSRSLFPLILASSLTLACSAQEAPAEPGPDAVSEEVASEDTPVDAAPEEAVAAAPWTVERLQRTLERTTFTVPSWACGEIGQLAEEERKDVDVACNAQQGEVKLIEFRVTASLPGDAEPGGARAVLRRDGQVFSALVYDLAAAERVTDKLLAEGLRLERLDDALIRERLEATGWTVGEATVDARPGKHRRDVPITRGNLDGTLVIVVEDEPYAQEERFRESTSVAVVQGSHRLDVHVSDVEASKEALVVFDGG